MKHIDEIIEIIEETLSKLRNLKENSEKEASEHQKFSQQLDDFGQDLTKLKDAII